MLILIVGDHGGQAATIERELAEFGLAWRLVWAEDTEAALSLPDDGRADVLVCGGDDGASDDVALLAQLRKLSARHPQAARIVLVEASDDVQALGALDVAHQVLPKPLETLALVEAIESVTELRNLLDDPVLKQAIGRVGSLPSAPEQYLALTRLLREPLVSGARIADALGQDPAFATKVLRMSNSAYYSAGREIGDLRTAVTRLGHSAVSRVVLASEVFSANRSGVNLDELRDRSLQTSRLASQILAGPSADMAATAGLLADIGRLLPPLAESVDGGEPIPHYIAGAYLLGLWGLPTPIVQAVAFHQRPARSRGGFWVTGAVHVASALVNGTEVDEAYLQSVGQLDRLPSWRALAESPAEA